jgi:hypothetical protein
MGLTPILLVGPFLAVVGIVSVIFVMRHKSVQTKSMYSSRRQTIERKVRAARQRTLGPAKHDEPDAAKAAPPVGAPGTPTFQPAAFEGPPVAPPSYDPSAAAPPTGFEPASPTAGSQPWDVGPTAPPPPPPPPVIVQVPPPEPVWTPSVEPTPQRPAVETPAGAGASWSIVGEVKQEAEVGTGKGKKKKKRGKEAAGGGASGWQLASGEAPDTFYEDEEVKKPSAAMAIAQYAVLVVGLVMVLIGVLVMVANSQVT